LEFYDEVGEDFVAVSGNVELFSDFPELFGYPTGDRTEVLEIGYKTLDVLYPW
jgi:hypothetical protein